MKRQTETWTKQYEASKTHEIKAMDNLISWLRENVPESAKTTIVHGDFRSVRGTQQYVVVSSSSSSYRVGDLSVLIPCLWFFHFVSRLDNLVFDENESKVLAVLDWELSTLGDPVTDLALNCLPYYLSSKFPTFKGSFGLRSLINMGLQHTTADHTTPHLTSPHHTTPHHTIPHHTTPHHTTPHHTIPHHTIPHHTTPHHTNTPTPHHTIPYHTTPHHTTPHHTTPHHTIPHHTIPHHTTPHHTVPHHTTPHHTTPHHTILCHTTPHHTTPHHTTPYCATPHHTTYTGLSF